MVEVVRLHNSEVHDQVREHLLLEVELALELGEHLGHRGHYREEVGQVDIQIHLAVLAWLGRLPG